MGNLSVIENRESIQPQNTDYEPLEKGKYSAEVEFSEVVSTKAGDGLMLKVRHLITEPGFEGKKVFTNFNIQNPSQKAQQIGLGQLSALAKACGLSSIPEESESLHGIPHVIKVDVEESPGYAPKNVVKGFYSLGSKAALTARAEKAVAVAKADSVPTDDTLSF